uniref:Reverse transcriptase domain-containing protein n=1 Tax=Tanacetum cinerariifolium TaxID=118510 RepID=A0A699GU13_TANCI|nr:reverse transcriptase domain-containing protein [Tanacetum cinerariifolium]
MRTLLKKVFKTFPCFVESFFRFLQEIDDLISKATSDVLSVGMPISAGMTASVPYVNENEVSLLLDFIIVWVPFIMANLHDLRLTALAFLISSGNVPSVSPALEPPVHDDPSVNKIYGSGSSSSSVVRVFGESSSGLSTMKSANIFPLTDNLGLQCIAHSPNLMLYFCSLPATSGLDNTCCNGWSVTTMIGFHNPMEITLLRAFFESFKEWSSTYTLRFLPICLWNALSTKRWEHPSRTFRWCSVMCLGTPVMSIGIHAKMSSLVTERDPLGPKTITHSNKTSMLLFKVIIPPSTRIFSISWAVDGTACNFLTPSLIIIPLYRDGDLTTTKFIQAKAECSSCLIVSSSCICPISHITSPLNLIKGVIAGTNWFLVFRRSRLKQCSYSISEADLPSTTVGEHRVKWADKLDDALCAFRIAFKIPTGCIPYKLVYKKACHVPIELEHQAYRALKWTNFNLKIAGNHRKVQLNELNELQDRAYENSLIYKEKTKKIHDAKIKNREFHIGDHVLLFNSRLNIFSGKLKSHWSGPFTIIEVFPYGTVELSQLNGPKFKVNGHRIKHYHGGDIPALDVPDLHLFPKDN